MDKGVAAALTGLLRASTAIDEELALIRAARPRDGFPHEKLLDALPPSGLLHRRTVDFSLETGDLPPTHLLTALTASAKQLASLHTAAQGLRSAVEWSSRFTAVDWWVRRRASELGLGDMTILVAPGRLGDFSIERTSRFRDVLVELGEAGRLLSGEDGGLAEEFAEFATKLERVRLLRVPPSDGISPAWHPLLLGHEIAHLRYTDLAVRSWMASLNPGDHGELVKSAIGDAAAQGDKVGAQLVNRSSWLGQLERWLVEVACDTVAEWFYGEAGLAALHTILTAYAVPHASLSHPPPDLRIAIQSAADVADLDIFRPVGDQFASNESQTTSAIVDLSLQLRDHVRDVLQADVPMEQDVVSEVTDATTIALTNELLPSSCDWPEDQVGTRATAIESGLVRGLWRRYLERAPDLPQSESAILKDVQFVSQAIDALEFAARFDQQRQQLDVEAKSRMPLPNVLWLRTRADRR